MKRRCVRILNQPLDCTVWKGSPTLCCLNDSRFKETIQERRGNERKPGKLSQNTHRVLGILFLTTQAGYDMLISPIRNVLACAQSLSHARLFATLWTAAHQAPLSTGFSGKSTGVGCHFPSPGDLTDPGSRKTHISCVSCIGRLILYHWAT